MSIRVGELINILRKYPADRYVFFSEVGSKQMRFVDNVRTTRSGNYPLLETDEAPNFDDIEGMADACWEEHHDSLTDFQKQAIMEFSELAYQAEKQRKMEAVI